MQLITWSNMHKCSLSSSHRVCFSPCCRFWQTQVQGKTGTASLKHNVLEFTEHNIADDYIRLLHTYIHTYTQVFALSQSGF